MDKQKAVELMENISRKEHELVCLGMTNVFGMEPEARVDLEARYKRVRSELDHLRGEYTKTTSPSES